MLEKSLFRKPKNMLENYGESLRKKPMVPDGMYLSCPECKTSQLKNELLANYGVCPKCGYHHKISARQRIKMLVDPDSFEEQNEDMMSGNPLDFPNYEDKLNKARKNSGEKEGVICGVATIKGRKTAMFIQEPDFILGSMGSVVGEKITRLFEYATEQKLPVIGYTVSGGARMQEGILSLMQMAKVSGAVKRHSDAGLLYVAVLTNPTTGGVTASFAMEGDIILAEPKALIAFAGPRVIEQTLRQTLPDGFQTSEFLLEKGFLDGIVLRSEQRDYLATLLEIHQRGREFPWM